MRTNIDIDDDLMAAAMAAGPYKTKKEAVEAGLALLKRQADYARLLALKGKLRWGWDDEDRPRSASQLQEPSVGYAGKARSRSGAKPSAAAKAVGRVRR